MSKNLNIAIIGYGKMGKIIEQIALERGHSVSLKVTSKNADFKSSDLKNTDVAIEFSLPEFAVSNISKCIDAKVPVAIGTTGWYEQFADVEDKVSKNSGCILPATNFSIGVNIFFEINKKLASLMNGQKQYEPTLTEIHHIQKLDAPSGTAITLAEGIIGEISRKSSWVNEKPMDDNELGIISERIPEVPGTHHVSYDSEIDNVTISHTAKNRKGFALGAVLAAEFIHNKKGIYSMSDVLSI